MMNGFECLESIKQNSNLKTIPVIIFTTTSDQNTINRSGELGAVAFMKKPGNYSELIAKLNLLIGTDFSKDPGAAMKAI
jgi:DNA-binding response OmpR family regulator